MAGKRESAGIKVLRAAHGVDTAVWSAGQKVQRSESGQRLWSVLTVALAVFAAVVWIGVAIDIARGDMHWLWIFMAPANAYVTHSILAGSWRRSTWGQR